MSRYVGIDLHRRRWVVVIMDEDGTRVSLRRIENLPLALAEVVAFTVTSLRTFSRTTTSVSLAIRAGSALAQRHRSRHSHTIGRRLV